MIVSDVNYDNRTCSLKSQLHGLIQKHPTITKVILIAGIILGIGVAASFPFITPILGITKGVSLAVTGGILTLVSSITLIALGLLAPCGRVLLLDGEKGTVACRVGFDLSRTLPRVSADGVLEFATRSLLRLKNLIAVRGVPGSSMVGPCDYFGNLGHLDKYAYSFNVQTFPPLIQRVPAADAAAQRPLKAFKKQNVTTIRARWVSGHEPAMQQKQAEYHLQPQNLRQSLFLNPGILEIEGGDIELNAFDPRGIDLSSFKARLVDNQVPFQISKKPLPVKDDYRVITYQYERGYADWQVEHGSGLFLEKHEFSQTITPLSPDSKGFVVLGRYNKKGDELELIGVQIPFGHTLIIEEDCIHGDTTLNGFFMMGMTSSHTTMRTADTVFLKNSESKGNMRITMPPEEAESPRFDFFRSPPSPYVLYSDATGSEKRGFRKQLKKESLICNPSSKLYFRALAGQVLPC